MIFLTKKTLTRDLIISLSILNSAVIILFALILYTVQARVERNKMLSNADNFANFFTSIIKTPYWTVSTEVIQQICNYTTALNLAHDITIYDESGKIFLNVKKDSTHHTDTLIRVKDIYYNDTYIGKIRVVFFTDAIIAMKQTIITVLIPLIIINSFIMIVFTLYLLNKILGKALERLNTGISQIIDGNYSSAISPVSQQDLNKIITGINTLSFSVAEREHRIKAINAELEIRIEERTRELRDAQSIIAEKAHKAGMADIATSVIHNVGNVLTSLITSSYELSTILKQSRALALHDVSTLLDSQRHRISEFFIHDSRGSKLIEYLSLLNEEIASENNDLIHLNDRIQQKAGSIKDIIAAQQNYASLTVYLELQQLSTIIEDALEILHASIQKNSITIEKHFSPSPEVLVQKTKMMHIFINIIKNACEAVTHLPRAKKRVTIVIDKGDNHMFCSIIDTGYGISDQNLDRIFNHGFTTKKGGHGFGLHSCANYIQEMNGTIKVTSEGENKGTSVTISLPIPKADG